MACFQIVGSLLMLIVAVVGCSPVPPAAHLPSMAAGAPTVLQLGWDHAQAFRVPPPIVLTPEQLTPYLSQWPGRYFTDWPVQLPDGRSAWVDVMPVNKEPWFCGVRVYRRDGSLQLREWDSLTGLPNAPGLWAYYGADGQTLRAEVDATALPGITVKFFDNLGRLSRIIQGDADKRIVWLEEAVDADGKITGVNGDRQHYAGPAHPSAATRPFFFASAER